jgi:ribonuclease J
VTRITVFGGAGEIGGNQILLEDPGGTLLFDFGKPIAAYHRLFYGQAAPSAARGLHDLLSLGLLPPLRELYRPDLLHPDWSPWPELGGGRPGRTDALLLSHAHLDHCGSLPYVDPGVPVLTSAATAMVLRHLQEFGGSQLESEYRYVRRRVLRNGALMAGQRQHESDHRQRRIQIPTAEPWDPVADLWAEPSGNRPWTEQPPLRSDRVGRLDVRWFPVDHSMAGSGACAVRTEAGWVVYTGDLRRHGRQSGLTRAFAAAAAALRPVLLVAEGTNVLESASPSEWAVRDRIAEAIAGADGMVICTFSARNLDRLLGVYEAARAAGRQLLITEREAGFLRLLRPLSPEIPDPESDPYICIYYRPRATDDTWHRFWRRPGRRPAAGAGSDRYLRAHPEEYVICFGLADMIELVGMKVRPGGLLIYSHHHPYSAGQQADLARLLAWADLFQLRVIGLTEEGFHASGHLCSRDLAELLEEIKPERLMPVHTEHPASFPSGPWNLLVPARGQPVEL